MRNNILLHEIGQYWKGTLYWTVALVALTALFLSFYPALVEQTTVFADILKSFPNEFKQLFGLSDLAIVSLTGYLGFTFTYATLLGAIQSMSLGMSVFAKEVSGKTSDFLMTKPVSRHQILISKIVTSFGLLVVVNVVFVISTYLVTLWVITEPFPFSTYLLIALSVFFVQMFFLAIGFLVGIWVHRVKNVVTISLPVVLGFYIIGMLDSLVGKEGIKYFTPFKFFDFEFIAAHNTYEWQFLWLGFVVIAISLYLCRKIYLSRDVHAV